MEIEKLMVTLEIVPQTVEADLNRWLKVHAELGEKENFKFSQAQENAMLDFAEYLKEIVDTINYYHLEK